MSHIAAIVMVGEPLPLDTPAGWVRHAQRAAAADLLSLLHNTPGVGSLTLASPTTESIDLGGADSLRTSTGPLHVGHFLANFVRQRRIEKLLLFGGGSAPLLRPDTVAEMVAQLAAPEPRLIVNNRHSTDWAAVTPANRLVDLAHRLPHDNMLGWVLSTEGELPVTALAPRAETRLDIDTPTDLMTLAAHPRTPAHLRAALDQLDLPTGPLNAILGLLETPATRLLIAGRIGPAAWAALNDATRCWIRVVSEERGMVASGRAARGVARSLLADHMERVGVDTFFHSLDRWCDAALIDSRVWLAHHQIEPSADDRFYSDLGRAGDVIEPRLRALTAAATQSPLPVLLGGHTLMGGSLFAFCDILWYKTSETQTEKE